jgi:hypothetical protein
LLHLHLTYFLELKVLVFRIGYKIKQIELVLQIGLSYVRMNFFLADIPGIKVAALNIHLRGDTLTLTGAVAPFEGPQETDSLQIKSQRRWQPYHRRMPAINTGGIDWQLTVYFPKPAAGLLFRLAANCSVVTAAKELSG